MEERVHRSKTGTGEGSLVGVLLSSGGRGQVAVRVDGEREDGADGGEDEFEAFFLDEDEVCNAC